MFNVLNTLFVVPQPYGLIIYQIFVKNTSTYMQLSFTEDIKLQYSQCETGSSMTVTSVRHKNKTTL